jgi:hypothetical protein
MDISNGQVERQAIADGQDLERFVKELISSPLLKHETRRFHWPSVSALVPALIKNVVCEPKEFDDAAQTLAERLYEKEKNAQSKVAHMDVQVQRGSLIQISFKRDGTPHLLFVKVLLSPFLGEKDYKRQDGYPLENTVLKMCIVELDLSGAPTSVSVADTNRRIAEYWWKDFLELTELTTDEVNTDTAFNSIEALLIRKLKSDYRSDYYHLRNNLIGYFRNNTHYNHTRMLDYVFGDYKPVNKLVDLASIKNAATDLPTKNKFDSRFNIIPERLNKRKRTVIALTDEIDLEIKDAIENLTATIHSATLKDGTKGVFVRSDPGFEYFQFSGKPTRASGGI